MRPDKVKTKELFESVPTFLEPLFAEKEYPWQVLGEIGTYMESLLENPPAGFTLLRDGILVGEGVTIHESATILPPAIFGAGTEIRPNAYVRGNVITGEGCVIGNASELKNAVLLHKVQVPHYNYVGDSVLGNFSHMGAGAVCSNLKADGKEVIIHGIEDYPTGRRKVGAILGDHADIGCGAVLNPGTVVGKHTSVYPLTAVRGVIQEHSIVKSMEQIAEKK